MIYRHVRQASTTIHQLSTLVTKYPSASVEYSIIPVAHVRPIKATRRKRLVLKTRPTRVVLLRLFRTRNVPDRVPIVPYQWYKTSVARYAAPSLDRSYRFGRQRRISVVSPSGSLAVGEDLQGAAERRNDRDKPSSQLCSRCGRIIYSIGWVARARERASERTGERSLEGRGERMRSR